MSSNFKVGLVQLNSGETLEENLPATLSLIREAATLGADLVMTPEMTDFYEPDLAQVEAKSYPESTHPLLKHAGELADELGVWLLLGSVNVRLEEGVANRSVLFNDSGQIATTYDKIHPFDVDIPDGQQYRESSVYRPGDQLATAEIPWGKLGLSICYDLRFPGQYRALARKGCDFLAVPAAFTELTGKSHWMSLLRARAIENGSLVFAPAQAGVHKGERRTYGHSVAIDPWGNILVEAADEVGVSIANVEPDLVGEVRQMIPSLGDDTSY
jgi:predicted amidohydrolase